MKYTKEYLEENKICIDLKGNIEHLYLIEKLYDCYYSYFHNNFPKDEILCPQRNTHARLYWYTRENYTVWTIEQLLEGINTEEWYY